MQGPSATFEALFNVLRTVTNEATVQYTLALLDELLTLHPDQAVALHFEAPASGGAPPNAPLVLSRLLSRTDWFTQVLPPARVPHSLARPCSGHCMILVTLAQTK